MEKLLKMIEEIAIKNWGGHYCIFRFTTNWRGCYGTISTHDSHTAFEGWREFKTMKDLLEAMIESPEEFSAY